MKDVVVTELSDSENPALGSKAGSSLKGSFAFLWNVRASCGRHKTARMSTAV